MWGGDTYKKSFFNPNEAIEGETISRCQIFKRIEKGFSMSVFSA